MKTGTTTRSSLSGQILAALFATLLLYAFDLKAILEDPRAAQTTAGQYGKLFLLGSSLEFFLLALMLAVFQGGTLFFFLLKKYLKSKATPLKFLQCALTALFVHAALFAVYKGLGVDYFSKRGIEGKFLTLWAICASSFFLMTFFCALRSKTDGGFLDYLELFCAQPLASFSKNQNLECGTILGPILCSLIFLCLATCNFSFSILERHIVGLHEVLALLSFMLLASICAGFGRRLNLPCPKTRGIIVFACAALLSLNTYYSFNLSQNPKLQNRAAQSSIHINSALMGMQKITDWDRDGYSNLYGGFDPNPWNRAINPSFGFFGNDANSQEPPIQAQLPSSVKETLFPGKNVLLITMDATRFDCIGPRAKGASLTPNIDQAFENSLKFNRSYSPSNATTMTFMSIFRGMNIFGWRNPDDYPTFGDIFRDNGYEVQILGGNNPVATFMSCGGAFGGFEAHRGAYFKESASSMNKSAGEFFARDHEKPFAFWMHYYDPHEPYSPYKNTTDQSLARERYEDEIRRVDDVFGEMWEGFKQSKHFENTVVVFFADHGEEFPEEHSMGYHGIQFYEAVWRVPFFMKLPNHCKGNIDATVCTLDLLPTLLDILGLPQTSPMEGRSLRPFLEDPTAKHPNRVVISQANLSNYYAIVKEDWKLIFHLRRNLFELYNVAADPKELSELSNEEPAKKKELEELLFSYMRVIQKR